MSTSGKKFFVIVNENSSSTIDLSSYVSDVDFIEDNPQSSLDIFVRRRNAEGNETVVSATLFVVENGMWTVLERFRESH